MGLLDKLVPKSLSSLFAKQSEPVTASGFRTFTEYSPQFSAWDGTLYQQAKTRSIVERIAVVCSKLKPEFVTPEGSGGALPRVQRMVASWPNDMMTWPDFLRRLATITFADTVAYVVPQYDPMDAGTIVGLWPMKPSRAEVVEFDGEPWIRLHTMTGDVQAFPFYDVAILTRFQYESDIFGGGNAPLDPTLRLMDAQRQAEEIALKTGADIRFIGRIGQIMHERDIADKRKRFAQDNLDPSVNTYGLLLYDGSIQDLQQVKHQSYTIDTDEMDRIDKALYAYFGINEKILDCSFSPEEWSSFYEATIEPFAIQLGEKLSQVLLTATQVRKGNRIMFSSSYLEYASVDSKIKVANLLTTTGTGTKNEVRDIFQLPRLPNGNVFMVRGEIYITDEDNNIIAESGGHGDGGTTWDPGPLDDIDEPDEPEPDESVRAVSKRLSELIERRLEGAGI